MKKLKKELIEHARFYILALILIGVAIVSFNYFDNKNLFNEYPIYSSDAQIFDDASEIIKQWQKYEGDPSDIRGIDAENIPFRCSRLKKDS